MLEILKNDNIYEIQTAFKASGFEYTQHSGMLCAKDKGDVLGYSLYYLERDKMTVIKIEPKEDIMLFDGILRSTLHIAAQNNILSAFYPEHFESEGILEKLQFIKDKQERRLNIDLLFGGCNCCG